MTTSYDNLPDHIRDALVNRGWSEEEINEYNDPNWAFDEYCNWKGLIGWGSHLRDALNKCNEAVIEEN